jgi:hypothetical protein
MKDNRNKLIDLLSDDNDWMAPWLRQEIRNVIAENVVLINKYVDLREAVARIEQDARADDNYETADKLQKVLRP